MNEFERDALEQRIRAYSEAGDRKRAATAIIEGYGREVLGFLIAHLRDREAAAEVFSQERYQLAKDKLRRMVERRRLVSTDRGR